MGNGGQRGGRGEWEGDNFEQEKRHEKTFFEQEFRHTMTIC